MNAKEFLLTDAKIQEAVSNGYDIRLEEHEWIEKMELYALTKQNSHKHGVMQGLEEKTIQLSKAVLDHINSKLHGYIEPSPSLNSVGVLAFDILHKLSSSPSVGREREETQE